MDLIEFKKFEDAFRDMWTELAETGSAIKPQEARLNYLAACPACSIAQKILSSISTANIFNRCRFCPIRVWRLDARKNNTYFPCEINQESPYSLWYRADTLFSPTDAVKTRKRLAKRISILKWTYLSIYRKVKV